MLRPSLLNTGFLDGLIYARLFRGLVQFNQVSGSTIEHNSNQAIIDRLEALLQKRPTDWHALFLLGDRYIQDKRYISGLEALTKAYDVRPRDPRSSFALATAYRVLTRAQYKGVHVDDLFQADVLRDPKLKTEIISFDPKASKEALEVLNLSIDEAAEKAMFLFEQTLILGVRKNEEYIVKESLQRMYADFPQIELKAKSSRTNQSGWMKISRKGASGVLSEAVEHYSRLRHLLDDLPRYRYELAEVIRLCQWAIATDNRLGDAYVLLANAYSLVDSQKASDKSTEVRYMNWAAVIIQHWADTPLSHYPFTKNVEIGKALHKDLLSFVSNELECSTEEAVRQLREWNQLFLFQALSPVSFQTIKQQLS